MKSKQLKHAEAANLDRNLVIVKSGYDLFPVFSFYEVLKICCFIFSINERVVVIKQSIIVLSG